MDVITEGIYFLYDNDELVYIGESDNLYRRIGQHISEGRKSFNRFELYPTSDRKRLESFLINMFKPKYNISMGVNLEYRETSSDLFPTLSIQEAIKKYDDYIGDPLIDEIADELQIYKGAVLSGLVKSNAPIYKLDGRFRIDRNWYLSHKNEIYKIL